jgi:hypothetical protein
MENIIYFPYILTALTSMKFTVFSNKAKFEILKEASLSNRKA